MKVLLTIILGLLSLITQAQSIQKSVLGSMGGTFSGTNIEIDFTVGDLRVDTASTGIWRVYSGYQHAMDTNNSIGIKEWIELKYSLYPNPTTDFVWINFTSSQDLNVFITLIDQNGKQLNNYQSFLIGKDKTQQKINLTDYPIGTYYLSLRKVNKQLIKTLKIVKR